MKKVVVARFSIKEQAVASFLELAECLIAASKEEPGNLVYKLYHEVEMPTDFLFYEEYVDMAAFDEHSKSAHFKDFVSKILPLLNGEIDIQTY